MRSPLRLIIYRCAYCIRKLYVIVPRCDKGALSSTLKRALRAARNAAATNVLLLVVEPEER